MIVPKLTKEQAAILGAYTGVCCGSFADFQKYAQEKLGRPIWTHQFASKALWAELKEASKTDFLMICNEGTL